MKRITILMLIAGLLSITLHAHTLEAEKEMCSDYDIKGSTIARAIAKHKAWTLARDKANVEAQVVCEKDMAGSRPLNLRFEKYCKASTYWNYRLCVSCTATAFFGCVKS